MKFQPKTENEIANENLIEPGEYDFEVVAAFDKVSKSGNDMIELKLRVFAERERVINDFLLEKIAYKLRHFAEATGLLDTYNSGDLIADDCVGKAGRVKIGIQKDKTGAYPDKNTVNDYVVDGTSEPKPVRLEQVALKDDDIPF